MPVAAKTRSPFLSDLTSLPTDSTSPASSCPSTGCLGLRMPDHSRIANPKGEVESPQLAIGRADRRGADSNQHLVVLRNGLQHVFELKNIRWSVVCAHYCSHGSPARAFAVVRIRPFNVVRMRCRALSAVRRCEPDIHDDSLTVLHDDDDLASSVTLVQIPKGLSGLSQWIRSVDDSSDPSGLDQLLESDQVVLVRCRDERAFLLAHEQ